MGDVDGTTLLVSALVTFLFKVHSIKTLIDLAGSEKVVSTSLVRRRVSKRSLKRINYLLGRSLYQ